MFLYGITEYGESVEDEWLIVYMLRELTRLFPCLWVRVADADGEFLLIEAANTLPDWINPEIDENRVWLHDAKLYIIPLPVDHDLKEKHVVKISLRHAVDYLRQKPNALLHSSLIEREAFYRLEKYPDFAKSSTHYSLVTVPRKLAFILHTLPKSIAMAVETFYLRDTISLQTIMSESSELVFPPDDLVTMSVQFSKVLFAQLKSQPFRPPPRWRHLFSTPSLGNAFASTHTPYSQLDLGMKITIGYEMLSRVAKTSRRRVVRELDIILQDLLEDGDDALPTDKDMEAWPDNQRYDDEGWLDIDFSDFERQLDGRRAVPPEKAPSGPNDVHAQIDLQKIVSRFEEFLHDEKADIDGVNFDEINEGDDDDDGYSVQSDGDSSAEDETVELNEKTFAQLIRDMTKRGVAASAVDDGMSGPNNGSRPVSRQSKVESNELQHLTAELEAELKQHGALNLNLSDDLQQTLELNQPPTQEESSQPFASSTTATDDGVVNIDYHLAQNIMESFKSQAGMAGPTSNILGMMGLVLPRDEED